MSNDGTHWTVQQFSTVAGRPWFALQKHNDAGVIWQATGYRHEMETLCRNHSITPDELKPINEAEFNRRSQTSGPKDCTVSKPRF